ncbi:hypothetical protein PIB30_078317 [Stylosanthes scabra]|uniref:O-fucosyltransferase family protein n=1 Tax=Stylosanthes scabra TaxID=79078 RepID=A0ABU6UPQ2_9FABA|nr:hypothetical protein [Stylosanthes scabra]
MLGRSVFSRPGSFRPENLGHSALAMIGNVCFSVFVVGVLVFTIIAATYEPEDPLFHPSTKITTFLTSESNATFKSDNTVVKTGEDFVAANETVFGSIINMEDVNNSANAESGGEAAAVATTECETNGPIDCRDPEVFHMLMRATIEKFKDHHFYRFGKAVPGSNDSTCDMAWRFRPKDGKAAAFYKDYRRFVIQRAENCSLSIVSIGEYHSGLNARKRKKNQKAGLEKAPPKVDQVTALPVFGETNVNDSLPVVESEASFRRGKYLIYVGGGDRCKSMNHYLWSFLCALGEAQYLNRTLIMDLSICLSSIYTSSKQDEEGKDFRFYFDFEHLKEAASVLDKEQFWTDWNKWHAKDGMNLHLVEDYKITPMKLREARNKELWPNLDAHTSPDALLSTLRDKIDDGRHLYIATNEPDTSFFDPLKDKYTTHFLDEYKDLWDETSEWNSDTTKLNSGVPVEFDGYMRVSVDTEVFLRGKKQIETFNDLTSDCKDGINTCNVQTN